MSQSQTVSQWLQGLAGKTVNTISSASKTAVNAVRSSSSGSTFGSVLGSSGTSSTGWFSSSGSSNLTTTSLSSTSFTMVLAYVGAVILVAFVIMLFIHFTVKPIFTLRPDGSNKIVIPGFDDGTLFWNKGSSPVINYKDLPIQNMSFGYSFIVDVFIQNPMQFSQYPRILFSRGANANNTPVSNTLLGVLNSYNVAIALLPDTTDLIVSVLNTNNNMENVILNNVPVQTPFRLGVVIMEQGLEVYRDGKLIRTRTFIAPPKSIQGDIQPATGSEVNIAKLRNLKIWPRILTTGEIRNAKPGMTSASDFGASPMPSTSTCAR